MRRRFPIGRMSIRLWVALLATLAALALPSVAAANHAFVDKWGSEGSGSSQLSLPSGIDTDSLDNVYVADWGNNRIQKFSSDGEPLARWGSAGSGDGQFNQPFDVTVDGSGNVFVADRANHRIQKFDSTGSFVAKWGSNGSSNGQFDLPSGVATDSAGNVYVTDWVNDRVQKFNSVGTYLAQWGGTGSGDGQFVNPSGIDVGPDDAVYVTDVGNDRVQKFDASGNFVTKWGSSGSADGQFIDPADVTVSGTKVFVSDNGNDRVQQFSTTGTFVYKFGSAGSGDGQFADDPAPRLAAGSLDTVFVADSGNHRIQKFGAPIAGSTARLSGTRLVFQADTGAANTVAVSLAAGTYTVSDTENVTPGAGCTTASATSVTCVSTGVSSLSITTRDGTDAVTVTAATPAVVEGGSGNDTITASAGANDTASYSTASGAVTVDLSIAGAQSTGGAGTDTLVGIENVTGSNFGDDLAGNANANALNGGGGTDEADYSTAATGVTVDLSNTGPQSTGGAGTDTLSSIEDLTGSPQNDVLTGSSESNQISAGNGDDSINVVGAGTDNADCGGGTADTATVDAQDTTAGCETVTIAGSGGGGGGGGTGGGTPAPGPGTGGGGGTTALVLSGLGASKMRSGKAGSFRYTLTLAARVTLTIERPGPGRRSGKACKKETKKNRKAKKCKFYAPVGKLTHAGKAGSNTAPFSGKPGGKAMKPGTYRLTAVAVAPSGARSASVSTNFKVTR